MNFFLKKMAHTIILSSSFFLLNTSYAQYPTQEEVQGIVYVCAAGRSVEVTGTINASFEKWLSGEINGEGKIADLGGIIASIEDDKIKLEVFKIYQSCIMPLLLKEPEDNVNNEEKTTTDTKTTTTQSSTGDKSPNIISNGDAPITINY